ncbi:Guanine deaminase [Sulfitobacter noctilucae]|uniref:guanine deaminase n=1 Tax=Sulfitobacter noctilucae TaxID=1342302 RepID=UPI00046ABC5A|nr:guanine deaminase [Sulfitobacter noctilucae]KIN61727.1 Guanine deaminase [Sulfitobacter noctilucae]
MSILTLLTGPVLRFSGNPFDQPWSEVVQIDTSGAVLLQDGKIAVVGQADALRQTHPTARHVAYDENHLICPGFVDAHVHYPQTAIIASWGKRLIDWLNDYTFPEEMRLADPDYAREIASRYLDLTRAQGTTTVASYCTIHPHSADALFEAAATRNQRIVAGKTCMDRNAPEGLRDTAQSAYDDSKALIERWHKKGRASYAITPRFTPTSTPDQLAALGALWAEHPDCLMQTHLSEQTDEIAWVSDLHPQARDYLDTYEGHGLLGDRALFGHAIHLEPREIDRLKETGAALVHCPTSNTFIGSGLFDMAGLSDQQMPIGLATDTGGGSSFSMLRTMAAAYEIGQLRGTPLHAAQLLWWATAGSARSLHLDDKIGTISEGYEADLTVLNLCSTSAIAQRHANATHHWDSLFATIMMGDDRAIADTWIAGSNEKPSLLVSAF